MKPNHESFQVPAWCFRGLIFTCLGLWKKIFNNFPKFPYYPLFPFSSQKNVGHFPNARGTSKMLRQLSCLLLLETATVWLQNLWTGSRQHGQVDAEQLTLRWQLLGHMAMDPQWPLLYHAKVNMCISFYLCSCMWAYRKRKMLLGDALETQIYCLLSAVACQNQWILINLIKHILQSLDQKQYLQIHRKKNSNSTIIATSALQHC